MPRLILVGGGHSHLLLLDHLARHCPADTGLLLISESRWQYYSGMLPGLLAGHYRLQDCRIDLRSLCRRVGFAWREAHVSGLDSARREITLADGERLPYDWLSLAVGSGVDTADLSGMADRLLAVKPFATFMQRWRVVVEEVSGKPAYHLVVAGGGAAAVELALAARYALGPVPQMTLCAGEEGIVPTLGGCTRRLVQRQLQSAEIEILNQRVTAVDGRLKSAAGATLAPDSVIAATGAAAPRWLNGSGLCVDERGFVLVDASHRSVSDERIFASGDICARSDVDLARSGVQAVRVSPVLAHNLLASMAGQPLRRFRPRRFVLYLLACGRRYAVASFGPLGFAGRWVWYWKDSIDRRFMRRFHF